MLVSLPDSAGVNPDRILAPCQYDEDGGQDCKLMGCGLSMRGKGLSWLFAGDIHHWCCVVVNEVLGGG